MKKGFLSILIFIFIISSFNVFAQTNKGATICNINRECSVESDGVCPELFFPPDPVTLKVPTCYIPDADCCQIKKAAWSSSPDSLNPVTTIKEGKKAYMYVETLNCDEKKAKLDVYLVKDNLILSDEELKSGKTIEKTISSTNKLSEQFIAYLDPAYGDGFTKFKFKVTINPTSESGLVELESSGGGEITTDNSCTDLIDNDVDGCADEASDCADGVENNPDINECSANVACAGWKCNTGDCLNGFRSVNCPALPSGCNLALPPPYVRCYEKTVPFPFFSKFNAAIVILLLIGYYGFKIYGKKVFNKKRK